MNCVEMTVSFCYLICVVLLNLLLSLGFLVFLALVLSLISRVNSLTRQATRLLDVLHKAEEAEKNLAVGSTPAQQKP